VTIAYAVIQAAPPAQRPIADYALIGDMRGAALVAIDGAIDWLCLERFDSTPLFFALLDAGQGGGCTVVPVAPVTRRSRRYLTATNILETTLTTAGGTLVITDCMPVTARSDASDTGPDCDAPGRLIRELRCTDGTVDFTLRVAPRFDWARADAAPVQHADGASWRDGALQLACTHRLTSDGRDLAIHADCLQHGWNPDLGVLTMEYGGADRQHRPRGATGGPHGGARQRRGTVCRANRSRHRRTHRQLPAKLHPYGADPRNCPHQPADSR
jgi:hypothetical protein